MFASTTFAQTSDQPVAVDSAIATQQSANSQNSPPPQGTPSPAVVPPPASTSVTTAETTGDTTADAQAPTDLWHQKYMFNWGPERERLADRGVTFNFFYINDAFDDVQHPEGVRQEFGGWGRIRGTVDVDFSKFSQAKGLTFHATGLWQYGQNMGGIIGSIANPSGLVSIHTVQLDSMWFQQSLLDGKLFLKAGQFAAEDFYGVQEYGGNFILEPLDYAFGNLGNVRASWDPASGPAGEIKVVPSKRFYVKTGLFSPRNYSSTGFDYHKTDDHGLDSSSTWDSEVGFFTDPNAPATRKSYSGIVNVGALYNGGQFFDYKNNANVTGNYTIYVQAAQPVYRVEPGSNRGLDITAGVNTGPAAKSEVPTEVTFGATFNGPFTARPQDAVSFGLVYSKIGGDYNNYLAIHSLAALSNETAVEFNYKAQIAPWLLIQPVFEHYVNVGGNDGKSASLVGLRLQTTF
jgi:porin